MSAAERTVVDVAIVGGGPGGTALAIRLADAGLRATVVEASGYHRPRIGESMAPDVGDALRAIGAWDAFLATGPLPSWGTRSVWSGDGSVEVHSHLGHPATHGWHVDRRALDDSLARLAVERGATVLTGEAVRTVEWVGDSWRVSTDARSLGAAVVVDASGRAARWSTALGSRSHRFDRLVGVGTVWDGVRGEHHVLVEACPLGWWYSAPVPGDGLVTLLMTDVDVVADHRLHDLDAWGRALAAAATTQRRCAGGRPARIRSFAAHSTRHRRVDHRPWLAIGDASLAVDPLTGSGVPRALASAAAAERAVRAFADRSVEAGELARAYEDERDRECHAYLVERLGYYGAARRFDTPFWRRRHDVADRRPDHAEHATAA